MLKITGRQKEAVKEYQAAFAHRPGFRGDAQQLGRGVAGSRSFRRSHRAFSGRVGNQPTIGRGHRNWGRALQAQGIFEEAITHLKAAVQIKPDFAKAYYELGKTQLLLHRASPAVVNLEKAVRLTPNDALAHRELGRALIMLEVWTMGLASIARA